MSTGQHLNFSHNKTILRDEEGKAACVPPIVFHINGKDFLVGIKTPNSRLLRSKKTTVTDDGDSESFFLAFPRKVCFIFMT